MKLWKIMATAIITTGPFWALGCGDASLTGETKKTSKREVLAGNQGTNGVEGQAQGAETLGTGADGKPCTKLALGNPDAPAQGPVQTPQPIPGSPANGAEPAPPPPPGGYAPCGPGQTAGPGQGPGVGVAVDINNQGKGPGGTQIGVGVGVPGGPVCIGKVCVQVGVGIPGHTGWGCKTGGCPSTGPLPPPPPPCPQNGPCNNQPCDSGKHSGWGSKWGGSWKKGGC